MKSNIAYNQIKTLLFGSILLGANLTAAYASNSGRDAGFIDNPVLQAQINALILDGAAPLQMQSAADAPTAQTQTVDSDEASDDSSVSLEIENGKVIVIDENEPAEPDTPIQETAAHCSPDALAVEIKHYKYDETPAANLVWSGFGGQKDLKFRIHRDAKDSLQALVKAARRDGVRLQPGSIFRSVARQRQIVNARIKQKQIPKQIYFTSAPAGFSEHHTGLAVDFSPINPNFAKSAGYRWLVKNANQYGWYQTFTPEYAKHSGVSEESWHWRYEGKNGEFAELFAASKKGAC